MNIVKRAKLTHIVISAILFGVGLCLAVWPSASARLICWLVGGICVLVGVAKLIGYFSNDIYRLAFQFDLALGIFTIVLGVVLLTRPDGVIAFVPALTGVYIIVDSVFKLQTAFDARRFGLRKWWAIFIGAILSGLFGLLLVLDPFEGARLLVVFLGVSLMLDGLLNICITAYTVKVVERKKGIEVDYEIRG